LWSTRSPASSTPLAIPTVGALVSNQKQLNQMLRQMQKMQQDMAAAQAALAEATVEGSSGGGVVRAVATGTGELRSVSIAPEVVDPDDVGMLEDLVVAAVSDALRRAHELQAKQMGAVTGGLDLGSLGNLFG
jgi:DNA-binding YbaB/EbfC family protein